MSEQFIGKVEFLNSSGKVIFTIDPDAGLVQVTHRAGTGQLLMDLTNTASLNLGGEGENYRARLDGTLGWLLLGGSDRNGRILLREGDKKHVIDLDAANAAVYVGAEGNEGDVIVRDGSGRNVFHVDGKRAAVFVGAEGNEGDVIVRNSSGAETIHLDGASGDVILTNADCAEDFDLAPAVVAEPGTVLVLGPDGTLGPSTTAYDKAVAGVVSGAGEYRPGIVLDRRPSETTRVPVALAGKVYCKVDATHEPVAVGDLLTTSSTPGHAMRATDPRRAFGAVIGKALRPLGGVGLIPILVALQ
jgi:hypothetical protein